MSNTVQLGDGGFVEYDIRVPKREELQQVIDLVNADDWNMSVDILTDIYDVQRDGFRVAVDKQGNILCELWKICVSHSLKKCYRVFL